MVLILMLRANSGTDPNPPRFDVPCGVLDGCSRPRNQRLAQNFLIY
jgi:hypothetical protein